MPIEPPPTTWELVPPPDDHPDDFAGIGADLAPGTILAGYRLGLFPMPAGSEIGWWSPAERAVFRVGGLRVSRSLRRSLRRFEIRVDTAFADVVFGCADPRRPHGWIDARIVEAYGELHRLGWAHSVEAWDDEGLAGGLYGISVGGLFAAESKFRRRTDASKAALVGLDGILRAAGDADMRLLDSQWPTPHLTSLGAITVTRAQYLRRLEAALPLPDPFAL